MANSITILHAEDEPGLAELTSEFLQRQDERFDIHHAANADEGEALLDDLDVDCIVSDYDMPGRNGLEFLKSVRDDHPDLPFILFTGKGSEEVASEAISAGVTDYLQKEGGSDQYTILANRIKNAVELRHAEEQAERTLTQLEAIAENSADAIVIIDSDSRIHFVNQAVTGFFGYDPAELEGEPLTTIMPERLREQHLAALDQYLTTGEKTVSWSNVELTGLHKDGSEMPLSVSFGEFQQGTDQRFVGIMRDISVQRQREQALREKQAELRKYELTVENSIDLLAACDTDYDLLFANEQYQDFHGIDSIDVSKTSLPEVLEDEWDRTVKAHVDRTLEGEIVRYEMERGRSNGDVQTLDIRYYPLREDDGTIIGVVAAMRDLTNVWEEKREREKIIERVTDAIVEVDENWRFTLVNQQAEALYDMSEEYLLGRDFWTVFTEARGTRFEEEYRTVMETREPTTFVEHFSQLDGWFDITVFPKDDGGLAFYFVEVTEQRQRQDDLEQSNALLSTLFNTLPAGVLAENESRNVLAVNERLFDLFGLPGTTEEAIGADCARIAEQVSEEFVDPSGFVEQIDELVSAREPKNNERLALQDGRTFERDYRPIELPDGQGHLWLYRDITDGTNLARQLKDLNRVTQELMSTDTQEEVVEIGVETARDLLDMDANSIHQYDTGSEELIPMEVTDDIYDLVGEPPTFSDGDSIAWRVYQRGEPLAVNDVHGDPDRHTPDTPIRSELYLPLGDYGILLAGSTSSEAFDDQDVLLGEILAGGLTTALEQIEQTEQLRDREHELTNQNDRLEEFASIVSHDLRNPLNVAEGRLELAQTECDSEHLDNVQQAHGRMWALIDDLLTLARDGESELDSEPVALKPLVEGCWTNIQTDAATLIIDTEQTFQGSKRRLKQLFENLMRNAIEHGGEDVTVMVGAMDDGFYVEDDGSGIPAGDRDDIFETGYSTNEGGTGFGLSIVKQVAEAHNWKIKITDRTAGGARFEITGVGVVAE